MTILLDDSPTKRRRFGWGRHLERLLWAMVAVAIVGIGVDRFTASDESTPSGAATGGGAGPAARTLAETAGELELATQRDPGDATAWQELTQVYVQRAAQTLDPSFYGRATAAADRASALAPDAPATLAAKAALAASLHHFSDAAALAQRAVDADGYHSGALAVLVDAQVEQGRYDDAARTLQTFANRKPGAPVLSRVSYLRELHGDITGARSAMAEARQAVAGAGAFQQATLAAYDGDLLWGQGDREAAAVAYLDALALEPRHPIATVGHARVLAADGRPDEAIEFLAEFVERTPVPAAATLLGELQESTGDSAAAAGSFDLVRALARLQADAGVDVDLDLALFEADHSPSTPELVARARQAVVDRPTVYGADALAWTLYRAGDIGGARTSLDAALRLGTVDPLLHFHAAAILDAAGDPLAARDHLEQVVARNPWFSVGLQPEARALASRLGVTWPVGAGS